MRVKKHRPVLSQILDLHNNYSNCCDLFFLQITQIKNGPTYMYFSNEVMITAVFCNQLGSFERRNLVSTKRNFFYSKRNSASSKWNLFCMRRIFVPQARNFATKFPLMPRNFVLVHHDLACEISPTFRTINTSQFRRVCLKRKFAICSPEFGEIRFHFFWTVMYLADFFKKQI